MFDWILDFFRNDISSILSSFETTLARLERFEARQLKTVARLQPKLDKALQDGARANAVAKKIGALIEKEVING